MKSCWAVFSVRSHIEIHTTSIVIFFSSAGFKQEEVLGYVDSNLGFKESNNE